MLAEIEPGGRVYAIYTISSGKPSTPTVIGHFNVYEKTSGENTEGMVDSNYFIRGYAIHGYHEVPTYAASHGCLRVPIPDAPAIYGWVRLGTPVDVYYENGGGSSRRASPTPGPNARDASAGRVCTRSVHPQHANEKADAESVHRSVRSRLTPLIGPFGCSSRT